MQKLEPHTTSNTNRDKQATHCNWMVKLRHLSYVILLGSPFFAFSTDCHDH